MPAYAIPVFLRQQQKMETTGTFKYQKNNLKKEILRPAWRKSHCLFGCQIPISINH
jgi:citronellyl-CoA synthetase